MVPKDSSQQPREIDFIKITLETVRLMSIDAKSPAQVCTVIEGKIDEP